jgi:hypothetical protein
VVKKFPLFPVIEGMKLAAVVALAAAELADVEADDALVAAAVAETLALVADVAAADADAFAWLA